jgi:hypothetical protein
LNKYNIENANSNYLVLLENIPLKMDAKNVLEMMTDLKRKKNRIWTLFRFCTFRIRNRIMSDLTILHGIKALLNGDIVGIDFDDYCVEFGHDNYNDNDIPAHNGQTKLIGKGFNVAKSFFQPKKTSALKKMRKQISGDQKLLLIYNSDAVFESYVPKPKKNEYQWKKAAPKNGQPTSSNNAIGPNDYFLSSCSSAALDSASSWYCKINYLCVL